MKTAKFLLFFLLVSMLLAPNCRRETGLLGPREVRIEKADGLTLVHNPAMPMHPEKTVRFEKEMTFGSEEEGPGAVYRPGPFAIDGEGHVHLAEASDCTIKVFGVDGRFFRAIGRKGQGPGEFERISFLGFGPDGRLLVTDSHARRTSLFDPEGDFIGSYQWTTNISVPDLVLDGAYVVLESVHEESGSKLFLKTYDFEGDELKSWGEFVLPEFKSITRAAAGGGAVTFGVSIPFARRSIITGDQTFERIYHCLNDAYLIESFDSEGRILMKIDRPYEPVPFSQADREEIMVRIPGTNQEVRDLYEDMPWPKVKSVTERMFCDDRGWLWLVTHEEKEEGGRKLQAFDIFNADGVYDARVWLEAAPGQWKFAAGKMYRFEEDEETGIRVLTRYRVVWE